MPVADLIIRLRDQASQGIGRIGGALAGLGGRANRAAEGTKSMTASMRDAVLQADAVKFALGKAQQAVGFLNSKFEEAKNLQLEQINAATTFSALTGQSSEQAAKFIENLNDSLAKSAATLPGATQDYKALAIAVQDNVLEAFKDPGGTLNQKGFEKTLISMSESFGALTAASTRDIGNTSLGLSKALGGASIAELRSIAFFEQNPVILNALEKELTSQGKQLKDLKVKERVALLEKIGKQFITDDFKKQAAESVDGLMQSFQSTLFDPSAGIFGIMRDLNPQTDGVQSVFSSLNAGLIELIGPSGLFFQLGDLLKSMGVELPDPMRELQRGVDFVTSGLKALNRTIGYVKDFIQAGGSVFDSLRLLPAMAGLDSGELVKVQIGAGVVSSALIAAGGFNLLATQFSRVDAAGKAYTVTLGQVLVNGTKAAVVQVRNLGTAILTLSRSTLVAAGSMVKFALAAPGQGLAAATRGLALLRAGMVGLAASAKGVTFASLLTGVQALAAAGWAGMLGGLKAGAIGIQAFGLATAKAGLAMLANPLVLGIAAIALAAALIYKYWQPLSQFFAGFVSGLQQSLAPIAPQMQAVAAAVAPVFGVVAQGVGMLISFFSNLLKPVQDTTGASRSFGETIGGFVGGAIMGTINLLGKLFGMISGGLGLVGNFVNMVASIRIPGMSVATAPSSPVATLAPAAPSTTPLAVGSRYQGQIGWAAGGFLGNLMAAAQQEIAKMPAGANLMLANSSETILPQGAMGALARTFLPAPVAPIAPARTFLPAPAAPAAPQITVQINGASGDPQAIAAEVIARLQTLFEQQLSTQF